MILPPTIETERLTLRAPRAEDFDVYLKTLMSERAGYVGGPFDYKGAYFDFCTEVAGWILNGFGLFSVEDRDSGAFAGVVILQRLPHYPENELGWVVQAEFEGRGYAFEAAMAARRYAYGTLGWDTVVSYIEAENIRSIALAERLGATRDDDAEKPGGDPDVLVYRHPAPEALAA